MDNLILGQCRSEDFIKFFKEKGITICMGHQAVDTVNDILVFEEHRLDLQKQIDQLRNDIQQMGINDAEIQNLEV